MVIRLICFAYPYGRAIVSLKAVLSVQYSVYLFPPENRFQGRSFLRHVCVWRYTEPETLLFVSGKPSSLSLLDKRNKTCIFLVFYQYLWIRVEFLLSSVPVMYILQR